MGKFQVREYHFLHRCTYKQAPGEGEPCNLKMVLELILGDNCWFSLTFFFFFFLH